MARVQDSSQTIRDIEIAMSTIAPPGLAQAWDNVGLLVGDRAAACRRVLLCIDLTPAVLGEAMAKKCDMVMAYHPPLFKPVNRLLADSDGTDALIHRAIATGIAIYSPHTALDAVNGGTNDVLAGLCGLKSTEPFEYVDAGKGEFKLVTFVPANNLDRVASAMFDAGAGRIGEYTRCSYRLEGEGTFFGSASTNPQVGRKGRLETVSETRLETVVADRALPNVIAALRRAHPYEEPAFDVYPLRPAPVAGIGRVGEFAPPVTLGALAMRLKRATKSRVVMTVGSAKKKIRRAAVCVGAAGRLPLDKPNAANCDVIITGEIRHHDALLIHRAGKSAIALGHWESERPVLKPLATRLAKAVNGARFILSTKDAGPFESISK